MSPLEAKKIIAALANGVDPETGEILPSESPYNRPKVIRALFLAVKTLERRDAKRAERNASLPGNAGRPWSEVEDKELLVMFDAGTPANEIANSHGRTPVAIASRLIRIGRIKDRAEARLDTHPASRSVVQPISLS